MKYQSILLLRHENFSTKYSNVVSALWVVFHQAGLDQGELVPSHLRGFLLGDADVLGELIEHLPTCESLPVAEQVAAAAAAGAFGRMGDGFGQIGHFGQI